MLFKIKELPTKVIAQIAAGEVIERPLSVVKELVENSIDAGATRIEIKLSRGGRNLISVSDNGIGIERYDMNMALYRHATSKLEGDNIENIQYLGFRGEALASIAAVAKVKIFSKKQSEQGLESHSNEVKGWLIESDPEQDCRKQPTFPMSCLPGTTVEVRDLFCYMPHRLRFLRKESTENAACIDLIERFALANPQITFSLKVDDRDVIYYEACEDQLTRISQVFGQDLINNFVKIELAKENLNINGYATIPVLSRNKQLSSYCYVNGRIIKDIFFHGAIKIAYFDVLPAGLHPSVILFINLPDTAIDVNVHPTKIQVRFAEEHSVRSAIIKALRDSIAKAKNNISIPSDLSQSFLLTNSSTGNASMFTDTNKLELASKQSYWDKNQNSIPSPISYLETRELGVDSKILNLVPKSYNQLLFDYKMADEGLVEKQQTNIVNSPNSKWLGEALCQVGLRYIIAQHHNGIAIIDQHAAHERLVLERLKQYYQSSLLTLDDQVEKTSQLGIPKQKLLVPEKIEFNPSIIEKLQSIKEQLSLLGFDLSFQILPSGMSLLIVETIPELLGQLDLQSFLIAMTEEDNLDHLLRKEYHSILSTIACHSSIRSGRKLNLIEMNALLRQIEEGHLVEQCNHGRPTYLFISKSELDKLFER